MVGSHKCKAMPSDTAHEDRDKSDCCTSEDDPSRLTSVNRYAIALLSGTADAGDLDEFDHCKYLPVIKPEDNAIG